MTLEQATAHLKKCGWLQDNGNLHSLVPYVDWDKNWPDNIEADGSFSPGDLGAIDVYVQYQIKKGA